MFKTTDLLKYNISVTFVTYFNDYCNAYFSNVIPDNVFEATFRQTQTKYIYNDTRPAANITLSIIEKYVDKTDGPNLLGMVFIVSLNSDIWSIHICFSPTVTTHCKIHSRVHFPGTNQY